MSDIEDMQDILMPCGVCGAGGGDLSPSEAHEIEQGHWFTSIPLCADCHRGPLLGLHGQQRAWKLRKLTERREGMPTVRRESQPVTVPTMEATQP
jgi:hypothetical protein